MLLGSILAGIAGILLVVVAAAALRRFGHDDEDPDGATGAHAGAMLSALFLLILAIAIVVPWTTADEARKNTYAEAQALSEVYWGAAPLPAADRQAVREGIRGYMRFVVDTEWDEMAHGRLSPDGWSKLDTVRIRVQNMSFPDENLQDAADNISERISEIYTARRQREIDAKQSLPSAVLIFTVISGVAMIVYPYLAGARPRRMTIVPLVVMAAMLGVSIYLVFDVNHTFSGSLAVSPAGFQGAIHELSRVP